jgi:hypothetical protein
VLAPVTLVVLLGTAGGGRPGDAPIGDAPIGDAPIQWGERALKIGALPAECPESARAALEAWHAWSSSHEYRLDLDQAGRVLFVSRGSNGRAPEQLALAVRAVARFDQELPAPPVRAEAKGPELADKPAEPPKPAAPTIPEDPEDPEGKHPWKLPPPKPSQTTAAPKKATTWGSQGQPLDTQTVTLFLLRDQDDFESLLGNLAERFPFLEVWAHEAKAQMGFVLGDPLCGAYLEQPEGVEEWDPDNELVNRSARLSLLRRFGDLPNWFVQGYAWHMELALRGSIYCFPWRDEFVGVGEHNGWDKVVQDRYQSAQLKPGDFMGWRRGKYLDPEAKASWATCEYLLAKEPAKLPGLLDQLRVFREEHGRIQDDPSSWRRDTNYEIPTIDQHKLFTQVLTEGYLFRATLFFRQELGKPAK